MLLLLILLNLCRCAQYVKHMHIKAEMRICKHELNWLETVKSCKIGKPRICIQTSVKTCMSEIHIQLIQCI